MYTIRMYFGSADLVYTYVVGFLVSANKFEPIVATDRLHHAIAILNALNGGKMPDDITPWTNVMQPQSAQKDREVTPLPADFKAGKLPPEVLAALEAETKEERHIDVDQHDRGRHRQSSPPVE